jgi:NarL family two-component system sensor histidine kinase LiaS
MKTMRRIRYQILSRLRQFRWKLTLSYTAVTVSALLVAEIVLFLGLSRYVTERSRLTPAELVDELNSSYVPLARRFLSKTPPDVAGLQTYLDQRDTAVVDIDPIRIGDFVFEVSSTNILYVIFVNSDGTLIGTLPHNVLENSTIGEEFVAQEITGLAGPFQAAEYGSLSTSELTTSMPGNTIVGSVPVIDAKDEYRILGTIAFLHRTQLWDVVTLTTLARQIGIGLLIITAIAGLLGMVFGSLTARGLAERLKRVLVSTQAWSRGDFSVFVNDPTGDELGQMAHGLNIMAAKLENLLEERRKLSIVDERNRLARDLHDSVKQQAFAASAQLGAARTHFGSDPAEAEIHLIEAEKLLNEIRHELTDLIRELRPVALEGRGLVPAVQEYAHDCANQNDIDIDVIVRGVRRLPLDIEQTLFRIVQGALSNVVRHSDATKAEVHLLFDPTMFTLIIKDYGKGFDASQDDTGLGIRSIRERAEALNASLIIDSGKGEGTTITLKCIC